MARMTDAKQTEAAHHHPSRSAPDTSWVFPGWGTAEDIVDINATPRTEEHLGVAPQHKLGEWKATAICGNDITSSVLYVSALCTVAAGVYAPFSLLSVGLVLFLFRAIYAEVGSALPLNGGAYNALLNTTRKSFASIAACLTVLSYIATAVISASEAVHYGLHVLYTSEQVTRLPIAWIAVAIVLLLLTFAVLNILGITESAIVALVIFALHMTTLVVLAALAAWYVYQDNGAMLAQNWATRELSVTGILRALFFGFAAGLLGVSGFESSANFIEEQKPGVFPKTLRNMWMAVFVFNPLMAFLGLAMIPIGEYSHHQETLLSRMGALSAGHWLELWVSVDAFLVLSGAVLTSYVGITGLVRRMALDRIMPSFLLRENSWRRTPHRIILGFFALCCSILLISRVQVSTLAGVYTLSFLGVMLLFAVGNRLLAIKRSRLPRAVRAGWVSVLVAAGAVFVGLIGKVLERDAAGVPIGRNNSVIFLIYFAVAMSIVAVMLYRISILRFLMVTTRWIYRRVRELNERVGTTATNTIREINSQGVVFFTRGDGPANLRRAIEYVKQNEQTSNLFVVHVYDDKARIPTRLANDLTRFDQLFPEIKIDFVAVKGKFGPEIIDRLSQRLGVPKNYMFIGCPGDSFPHNLADLGGVRLIV